MNDSGFDLIVNRICIICQVCFLHVVLCFRHVSYDCVYYVTRLYIFGWLVGLCVCDVCWYSSCMCGMFSCLCRIDVVGFVGKM